MLCFVALKYIPATTVAIYRRCYFRLPDSLLILLSKYYWPVIGSGVRMCCDSGPNHSKLRLVGRWAASGEDTATAYRLYRRQSPRRKVKQAKSAKTDIFTPAALENKHRHSQRSLLHNATWRLNISCANTWSCAIDCCLELITMKSCILSPLFKYAYAAHHIKFNQIYLHIGPLHRCLGPISEMR